MHADHDTADESLSQWLRREISAAEGPVLLIGDPPAGLDGRPGLHLRSLDTADPVPDEHGRFELAVTMGVLERMAPDAARAVVAALRDRCARRLLVVLETPAPARGLGCSELRALGLERVATLRGPRGATAVFGFDIDRYKQTPEWLNPRDWANPQMWDKARW